MKIEKAETTIGKINALDTENYSFVSCFLYKSYIYLLTKKVWLLD